MNPGITDQEHWVKCSNVQKTLYSTLIRCTETNGSYRLNLNVGHYFELNSAVVLPGQFAGTFAGMYIYVMTCLCFVILLTWKHLSVFALNQHR